MIVIPNKINGRTVTTIEKQAFYYNTDIKQISIPDSIEVIKNDAFSGCHNLTVFMESTRPASLSDNAFGWESSVGNETSVKLTVVPSTAVGTYRKALKWEFYKARICHEGQIDGDFVIEGDTLLRYIGNDKHIEVPDGIVHIADYALRRSNWETITVPASVQTIGIIALYKAGEWDYPQQTADYYNAVYFRSEIPPAQKNLSFSMGTLFPVYYTECYGVWLVVPDSAVAVYKAAWQGCPWQIMGETEYNAL